MSPAGLVASPSQPADEERQQAQELVEALGNQDKFIEQDKLENEEDRSEHLLEKRSGPTLNQQSLITPGQQFQ